MSHTILFIHPKENPLTRTYSEYETTEECLEAVCKIFEEHLKRRSLNVPTITYDIMQLFDFLDSLVDVSCLVFQQSTNSYAPYGREWIKDQVYQMFRRTLVGQT